MNLLEMIKSLFIRKKVDPQQEDMPRYAKGTDIAYDPNLISKLRQEHELLLQKFTQINFLTAENEFDKAATILLEFKNALLEHLHTENLKLYAYLQYSLSDKPAEYAQMRTFRKEINAIGKVAVEFFTKYSVAPDHSNKIEFLEELKGLGTVLRQRIQREEQQLYTMYLKQL